MPRRGLWHASRPSREHRPGSAGPAATGSSLRPQAALPAGTKHPNRRRMTTGGSPNPRSPSSPNPGRTARTPPNAASVPSSPRPLQPDVCLARLGPPPAPGEAGRAERSEGTVRSTTLAPQRLTMANLLRDQATHAARTVQGTLRHRAPLVHLRPDRSAHAHLHRPRPPLQTRLGGMGPPPASSWPWLTRTTTCSPGLDRRARGAAPIPAHHQGRLRERRVRRHAVTGQWARYRCRGASGAG